MIFIYKYLIKQKTRLLAGLMFYTGVENSTYRFRKALGMSLNVDPTAPVARI
jgi:hypothetical protein